MNKRGQSIIEYALIAILVILGIVTMGPYVLRSVNAHFQLWDDSSQDSFSEKLTQAPVNDMPAVSTNCQCSSAPGSCGGVTITGGQGTCGPNERIINHTCSLQGCDGAPATSCIPDNNCCTTYYPEGCGQTPLGTSPLPTNDCYYGQRITATQCSGLPIKCTADNTCPTPSCVGTLPPNAVVCPNTTSNLDQNYGYTLVGADSQLDCSLTPNCTTYCGNPNIKCEYSAPAPYIVGISFAGQLIANCRLSTQWYEAGGDLGPFGWTIDVTNGVFTYGQNKLATDIFPILVLQMNDQSTQNVNLNAYSSGSTLPGDWSHIISATIQITGHVAVSGNNGNYLRVEPTPSNEIEIDWYDNSGKNRGKACWNMCVDVYTGNGNGIPGC